MARWSTASYRRGRAHRCGPGIISSIDGAAAGGLYAAQMSELNKHLERVQGIAARARAFEANQAADPKAFSRSLVEDLGALAEAVIELIKRA